MRCVYFPSSTETVYGKLRRTADDNKYRIIDSNNSIVSTVTLSTSLSNHQLIVLLPKKETVFAIDFSLHIDLWYNSSIRREYIVDSKENKYANHPSQFINAPSAQPDTIDAYFKCSLCIVKQTNNTLTVIKPGDIKRIDSHWILIYHISQTIHHAPAFTVVYREIYDINQLLSFLKQHLDLGQTYTNDDIVYAANRSNLVTDTSNYLSNIENASNFDFQNNFVIKKSYHTAASNELIVSPLSLIHIRSNPQFVHIHCLMNTVTRLILIIYQTYQFNYLVKIKLYILNQYHFVNI